MEELRFWLGTHRPNWLALTDAPLFLSRRWLAPRKTLPEATGEWALDSGGFTELSTYGEWRTSAGQYAGEIRRFASEIGQLAWVAPQDWMCEPFVLERTALTVREHQERTIRSVLKLRGTVGEPVIPVLQGWERDDYLRHADMYERAGIDLAQEPLVGLGSVCRRQNTVEAASIVRSLLPLRLHGFGFKVAGLESCADALASADSMAWSYRARHDRPLPGCTHKSCANCLRYALRWRVRVLDILNQERIPCAV